MSARGGGARVRLRPLRASDATVYAAWMADDELRELTGTEEPLTEDDVIGAARLAEADEGVAAFVVLTADGDGAEGSAEWTMVGDVNIRMNDPDDPRRAEVDVMVAERSARRKGVAAAAVRAALAHGTQRMGAGSFVAKVRGWPGWTGGAWARGSAAC